MESNTNIAVLLTPGIGHLIPLVEFGKRLHKNHNISTTLIIPTDSPLPIIPETSFLSTLPSSITYVLLPPVTLPNDIRNETRTALIIPRSLPSITDTIRSLHPIKKFVAFVVDVFGTDGFQVAFQFNIPPYIFFTSTAMVLSFVFMLPKLDQTVTCEYGDMHGKLKIPGCVPVKWKDLLSPVLDRNNDAYKWVLYHAKRYSLAEGILLNSFPQLENGAIMFLQDKKESDKPTVYPVGPLVQMGTELLSSERYDSLTWMDDQPIGSILYVSFGSRGILSHDQMIELALGLEISEHRFLWVVRCPRDRNVENSDDPLDYLPHGFLDRTRGRGVVVPMWAPQAQILAHGSVGGFVTHGGWNSALESIVNGVPLIVWPLYAEQRMNAVLLHEDLKVGLKLEMGDNGMIGKEEISNVVKSLMEGKQGKVIKKRMSELKDAAMEEVIGENGSSTIALAELSNNWKGKH